MKLKDILLEVEGNRTRYFEAARHATKKDLGESGEMDLDDTWSFEVPLTARNVYNFYFLRGIKSYYPELLKTKMGEFLFKDYLAKFKEKYEKTFRELIARQIAKYMYRGRIDSDFPVLGEIDVTDIKGNTEILRHKSPPALCMLMGKTWRSDMKRRNRRWEEITNHYATLCRSASPNDILLAIDMLNNAVHNTRSSVLDKFPNYYSQLDIAFKDAASIKNLNQYAGKVDRDLWHLFRSGLT